MMDKIKSDLFTIHGAITTMIHALLVVGLIASYVFIRVDFLGEDATLPSLSHGKLK